MMVEEEEQDMPAFLLAISEQNVGVGLMVIGILSFF